MTKKVMELVDASEGKMTNKVEENPETISWLNNKVPIWKDILKPCKATGYCVYGCIVEVMPLRKEKDHMSCGYWGHDCPAFYNAECVVILPIGDKVIGKTPCEIDATKEEVEKSNKELLMRYENFYGQLANEIKEERKIRKNKVKDNKLVRKEVE